MKQRIIFMQLAALLLMFCWGSAFADSCVTAACHQQIGALKMPHEPVKEGDCSPCHQQNVKQHPQPGGKSFQLTAKVPELCSQCHDAKGKKKVVHPPVKDGDCLACHRPHGTNNRFLLDVGGDQTELCLGCHDSAPFRQNFMHGPAAVGDCTKCHDPHEASGKFLLNQPVRDICLKCHADLAQSLKTSPVVHPPVRDDPCTDCHNPHGSTVASILKKKMPGLCVDCHDDMSKKLTGLKVPHKPLSQPTSCASCHAVHYSKSRGLLPTGGMDLCLGCHDKDNLGDPPLKNIRKDITGKKYLHGPIQKGDCKACHDPHGSNYFRMLRGNYPAELYVPYRDGLYDACLNCHNKDLLRFPETATATGFRNGTRNLHYVHVANTSKGRTCRICHEPHASNGEKLINLEGMKFGAWRIPINFKKAPTGGSCAPGCHRMFKYDREKPERY